MKIKTARLSGGGIIINGTKSLPNNNTGWLRKVYDTWLEQGNELEAQFTLEESKVAKSAEEREWRNSELAAADIAINKLEDTGGDPSSLREYRIALRDYPQHLDFPYSDRPTRPAG